MSLLSYPEVKFEVVAVAEETSGKLVGFDSDYYGDSYAEQIGDLSGELLQHYVETGAALEFQPTYWFNPTFYRARYADLASLDGADLLVHFVNFGVDEGRATNKHLALFDGGRYLLQYRDVFDYVVAHADDFGADETGGVITTAMSRNLLNA
jgi:hypothetical protein